MVFSAPTFLFVFLPAVLVATWLAPTRLRRYVILAASAAFYFWGVQEFLFAVWASTLVDWGIGLGIARARRDGRTGLARALLIGSLLQNLGLLAYYKYAGFAADQLDRLSTFLDGPSHQVAAIALPIGISFFTFEKISYVVDVWRGDVEARRDPIDVLLFVSLFPRSIAGPIVRLREIQDDLRRPTPTLDGVSEGAVRFAYGLAKKVLIADQIAAIADASFAAAPAGTLTTSAAWIGALAFSLQLYFDFSGYSDMAIGIGKMLGFTLPENFRRPYSSVSITDFWRRWHMTLSRWFRDYLYVPLGGNRHGSAATYRNLIIVFTLTGLWHGAAWTFVLWGLYHGAWMLVERRMGWRDVDGQRPHHLVWRRAVTFLIVLIGWVLFRADSLDVASSYYHAMFVPTGGLTPAVHAVLSNQAITVLALASLILVLPAARAGGPWLSSAAGRVPAVLRVAALGAVFPLTLAFTLSNGFSPFLYFQF